MLRRCAIWKHISYMQAYYAFSRDDRWTGDVYSAAVICWVCRMCFVRPKVNGIGGTQFNYSSFSCIQGTSWNISPWLTCLWRLTGGRSVFPLTPTATPPCCIFVLSHCPLRLFLLPPVLVCVLGGLNFFKQTKISHCVEVKTIERKLRLENVRRNNNFTIKTYNFTRWFQKIVPHLFSSTKIGGGHYFLWISSRNENYPWIYIYYILVELSVDIHYLWIYIYYILLYFTIKNYRF